MSTVRVGMVPSHAVIDPQLRNGSISMSAVAPLVDATRIEAFFLCLDRSPGMLRVVLPHCLLEDDAKRLVGGLWSLRAMDDDLHEDDQEEEIFDFVLPIDVRLPMDFRQ